MRQIASRYRSSTALLTIMTALTTGLAFQASEAEAACTTAGMITTCNATAPNPYTARIGTGPGNDSRTVTVNNGGQVSTVNTNAISLGNGASITIRNGGSVGNSAAAGSNGAWGTGANTIEFGSNGRLTIEAGGSVIKTGSSSNAEAVNVHGFGNTILNHGVIRAAGSAAIWFEDQTSGAKNTVDNYGTIERVGGGAVFGTSGANGIAFRNRTGAVVIGDLSFAGGSDDLYFYAGSLVTGSINGGGGINNLTLEGAAGSNDTLAGNIQSFTTLTKDGEGKWTVSGSLSGFTIATVNQGTLALTGNNAGYTGNVVVNPDGILEARAQSLPTKAVLANNVNNVQNNGLVRFTQPDNGSYIGQITGVGAVEKSRRRCFNADAVYRRWQYL